MKQVVMRKKKIRKQIVLKLFWWRKKKGGQFFFDEKPISWEFFFCDENNVLLNNILLLTKKMYAKFSEGKKCEGKKVCDDQIWWWQKLIKFKFLQNSNSNCVKISKLKLWENSISDKSERKKALGKNNLTPWQPMKCILGSLLRSSNVLVNNFAWWQDGSSEQIGSGETVFFKHSMSGKT